MNIAARLQQAVSENPSKVVLTRGGETLNGGALDARCGGVAHDLADQGLGRGASIVIACEDPLETVIGLIGGLLAGCTVAPLNPRLTGDERQQIIGQLSPDHVVSGLTGREQIFEATVVEAEDPAIILFTSGSTGIPKGVVLSHRAVSAGLDIWMEGALMITPDDVVLSVLPLGHSYGLFGTILSPLLAGASSVLMPRFDVAEVLKMISRHQVTILPGVATMFRRVLDSGLLAGADLSSLRFAMTGAAPCPWDIAEGWKDATDTRIVRGYGMSELFRPISYAPDNLPEVPEAIGRALPGVELKTVGEDGKPPPQGETGELWIRTPACMTEYVGRPEETEAVLEDGWFKTGDLAVISPEGLVHLVGRKKDIILRGGYTIVPGEVEAVLTEHPDVSEAAVIGIPSREMGEEIAAFVVLQGDVALLEDALMAFCRERLAYKYPRFIQFLPGLPRGATGKVDKVALQKRGKSMAKRGNH